MKKLRIIVADAQLETVPEELWQENAVKNDSKRRKRHPSRILLYTPMHYTAMIRQGLDLSKHGRPDITQDILKTITNHPLNKEMEIEIYIHTNKGVIIWVNNKTRIPHNYYQFEGLIVQLLKKGMVPPDSGEFMKKVDITIDELLEGKVYLLHEKGEDFSKVDWNQDERITFVIGGFQEGDYSERYLAIENKIRVYDKPLYAGTATCILLTKLMDMLE